MTGRAFPIHFDEPRLDKVTLAVLPLDRFSGRVVAGGVRAAVEGLPDRPIRNRSGLLVFVNLPERPQYTVTIDASAAGYLPPEPTTFVPPAAGDTDASKRRHLVRLTPRPGFPFADGTAVIRGVVTSGGEAAAGVRVWIEPVVDAPPVGDPPDGFETLSDERGAFALPLTLPPAELLRGDIALQDDHPLLSIHLERGGQARDLLPRPLKDGKAHIFSEPIQLDGINEPGFFDPSNP